MKVKSESEVAQLCPTPSDPMDCVQPSGLLHPWDSPGKSTGVGCHRLLPNSMLAILITASLVAQLVKNPPAMQETPVRFLGGEDPLEKG